MPSTLLQNTLIFEGLTDQELDQIDAICTDKSYPAGAIIFDERSRGDALYIVVEGQVDIRILPRRADQPVTATPKSISNAFGGDCFGEIALVDEGLRTASAHCVTDVKVKEIKRADLMAVFEKHPRIGYVVMSNIAVDMSSKLRSADLAIGAMLSRGRRRTTQ